jgi:hypothetical protein
VLEHVARSVKQIQPAHGAQPEIIILIKIKNVDVVIDQAVGILVTVKKMGELFGPRIIAIQAALARPKPKIAILIL